MFPDKASIEFNHRSPATGKVSSAIIKLKVPPNGRYVRSAPFLNDEFAKQKYLIEVQFHSDGNDGFLFRGELGEPTVIQDENFGEIISIPCESIFRTIRETYGSRVELKQTPQIRFIQTVIDHDLQHQGTNGTTIQFKGGDPFTAIDLPGSKILNRVWIPFGPTKIKKLLNEVIDVLEDAPQLGGKLLDYFYDEDPSTVNTRVTDIFAEEFGKNSSGVVINPISFGAQGEGAEKNKQVNTDNVAYKNHVVAKGDARSGTTPPNLQRFRSQLLNGQNRPLHVILATYNEGDGVRVNFPGSFPDQRYFTALGTTTATPALTAGGAVDPTWYEDFTIDPANSGSVNQAAFYSPNPWFSDKTLADANIIGKQNAIFGAGQELENYAGAFFDWNIERTLYDRPIADDFYDRCSVKSVIKRADAPPLKAELYNGYRIILGTYGIDDPSIGPGFEGRGVTVDGNNAFVASNRGRVLEYNGNPNGQQGLGLNDRDTDGNGWIVSSAPVDTGANGQDTATDIQTMKVLKWEVGAGGGARVDGDWIDGWDIASSPELGGTPFHVVKETTLVEGATGIPNQAYQARFEFKSKQNLAGNTGRRFSKPTGLAGNRNSRGVWLSWMQPYPYIPTGTFDQGEVCGGSPTYPYFDAYNLNRTCDGTEGWNSGLATEELGGVTGVHFKLKVGWWTGITENPSDLAVGYANMPHVYFGMDKWGHYTFIDFDQPANNQWETHDLETGVRSSNNSFFSRFDELANVFGYVLPYNWFIPEREFTGRAFDWRFIKYQGIFSKYMYSEDAGHYLGAIEQFWKDTTATFEQIGSKTLNGLTQIANLIPGVDIPTKPLSLNVVIDHANIAIDEFCFITEMYANSDDTPALDARTEFATYESERDYLTLKARARALKARKQFFPQFWHMGSIADVRLRVGLLFTASGPEVPGGTKELVCAEVKFTDDMDGVRMQMLGVNKFVATAGS